MTSPIHSEWDTLSGEFAEAAEQVGKYVVAIQGGSRIGASGVIWRPGLAITASHNLRRTEDLEAIFFDRSRAKLTLLGRDSGTDIAVLRVDNSGSESAQRTAESKNVRVGQVVLAVGRSRFGDLAASAGIVARLGSEWQSWRGGAIDSLLRPDVTLYAGQAGSALIDSSCQVLGMNTPALARAATITVPSKTIDRVVSEIVEHGGVFRPYLGIAMQPVSVPENLTAKLHGLKKALMIMQVEAESPSSQAGLMLGDLIVDINSRAISGIDDIQRVLRSARRGDVAEIGYVRAGHLASAKVKLGDRRAK